jgi:hypothetical protein
MGKREHANIYKVAFLAVFEGVSESSCGQAPMHLGRNKHGGKRSTIPVLFGEDEQRRTYGGKIKQALPFSMRDNLQIS